MFDVNLRADQATINKQLLAAVEIVQTNAQTTTPGGGGGGGGAVDSVNGRTGAVTLTKADVGLANVDNTADSAKPISTATQTALNAKANASAVNAALDLKLNASKITVGATAPVSPSIGDLWVDTN